MSVMETESEPKREPSDVQCGTHVYFKTIRRFHFLNGKRNMERLSPALAGMERTDWGGLYRLCLYCFLYDLE